MKRQLVIVYHRQPYEELTRPDGTVEYVENKSPNGIVPTLKSFFANVDRGAWVAWKKVGKNGQADWPRKITIDDSHGQYDVVRLPLTSTEVSKFYHETSKEAFWPILHSFPWQFNYDGTDWDAYVDVNRKFAEAALEVAEDDALIWIHDYNLWLAPMFIREQRPNARIAFFHHTPFPAPDIFNILPWRREIIESLLECDLVGFHIPRYAKNFADVAKGLCGADVVVRTPSPETLSPRGTALSEPNFGSVLSYQGREIQVDAWPVGTNPELIDRLLESEPSEQVVRSLDESLGDQKLIVSIGRVDYVKGTKEMLLSFERVLEKRPDLHGKVKLCVTSVSAANGMKVYANAKRTIEHLTGRINGRFSTLDWTPILFFTTALPFHEVIAYYKRADVCWTTPLRDGLNLVAKEYVAAHGGRDGVLVLSEFTGVAVELPQAVLTNPYSSKSMDDAIERALDMPAEEQRARMTAMYDNVVRYDIAHWAEHCFRRFEDITSFPEEAVPHSA